MPCFEPKGSAFRAKVAIVGAKLTFNTDSCYEPREKCRMGQVFGAFSLHFGGKFEKYANYRRRSPPVSPYRTLRRNYFEIIQQKISKTS